MKSIKCLCLVFLFGCSMEPKHLKFSAYPSEMREAAKRDGFTLQSIKVTWANEFGADTYKWPLTFLIGLLVGLLANPAAPNGVFQDRAFWTFTFWIMCLWLGLFVIWNLCYLFCVKLAGKPKWDDGVAVSLTWRLYFFAFIPLFVACFWWFMIHTP